MSSVSSLGPGNANNLSQIMAMLQAIGTQPPTPAPSPLSLPNSVTDTASFTTVSAGAYNPPLQPGGAPPLGADQLQQLMQIVQQLFMMLQQVMQVLGMRLGNPAPGAQVPFAPQDAAAQQALQQQQAYQQQQQAMQQQQAYQQQLALQQQQAYQQQQALQQQQAYQQQLALQQQQAYQQQLALQQQQPQQASQQQVLQQQQAYQQQLAYQQYMAQQAQQAQQVQQAPPVNNTPPANYAKIGVVEQSMTFLMSQLQKYPSPQDPRNNQLQQRLALLNQIRAHLINPVAIPASSLNLPQGVTVDSAVADLQKTMAMIQNGQQASGW